MSSKSSERPYILNAYIFKMEILSMFWSTLAYTVIFILKAKQLQF